MAAAMMCCTGPCWPPFASGRPLASQIPYNAAHPLNGAGSLVAQPLQTQRRGGMGGWVRHIEASRCTSVRWGPERFYSADVHLDPGVLSVAVAERYGGSPVRYMHGSRRRISWLQTPR